MKSEEWKKWRKEIRMTICLNVTSMIISGAAMFLSISSLMSDHCEKQVAELQEKQK